MKKYITFFILIFLLLLTSCSRSPQEKFSDSKILYNAWAEFHEKKDLESCQSFISSLENYQIENFNSYPELKKSAEVQMEICREQSQNIMNILSKNAQLDNVNRLELEESIQKIDLCMLAYLRNQNYALEETHQTYYKYFLLYIITFGVGAVILVFLNIREIKKRDKIIYNSEQFLRHSMEIQEAERRRISRELHDTVAQSMRYVSLLAENLSEKEAAQKIISTQNQNIQDIRKLCYNLTPPEVSGNDMISALELLGHKTFDEEGTFDVRIVAEDSIDFSKWNNEQLMNIYRIIQEAFQNIKKHAAASEVTVLFKESPGEHDKKHLKILITDDGCGMNEQLVSQINNGLFDNSKTFHFGVRNIVERVQLLGGTVIYRSEPDYGTQITVEI